MIYASIYTCRLEVKSLSRAVQSVLLMKGAGIEVSQHLPKPAVQKEGEDTHGTQRAT